MIFSAAKESFEQLCRDISDVRWADIAFGNAVRFSFRGHDHIGFLRGRNRGVFLGLGEEVDRKVAARTIIDGDAMRTKGRMKMLRRYVDQKMRCAICKKPMSITDATRDHITPRSKGGGRDWDNIQICCRTCNMRKGDK